ncbi:MAG: acyl-CoA dehydrogenase family protein [Actinobacteria bacterium]|nr:acyl-CoA dehydrogenase family protein [Micrococcales bacterium]MCB0902911.1 acyl-CoA dehydrogenase family protein [Actinomycetota bacterium]MCO5298407.1 acyl-CoA dehydrogenase family protein [Candidatus Nanopelagicales bacterium]MCB9427471.1 acyl-CoA dehydrogenase family protein [Actinomycetota bacterium]HPJ18905.1 acyl-CoA dehydrogenase family protein [Actinomycetota bacterium]
MADEFMTEERTALTATVRDFTAEHIVGNLPEWERTGDIPRELHKRAGDLGLLGIGFDESVGGSGGDLADGYAVTEAILSAGGSGGLIAGLFTHGIAIPHIIDSGNQDLIDRWVRPVFAGDKIACLAVTEPGGGSDVANLRTVADESGDSWVLNGSKTFITSGARADVAVVAARLRGVSGAQGVGLFAVPTDQPGYQVTSRLQKMGWHCSDTAEFGLVDARGELITEQGFASLARHFATERLSLGVTGYATAARCVDLTREWITQRETFGRPLSTRQVIRHTFVEMSRRTDVARSYIRNMTLSDEVTVLDAIYAKQTGVNCAAFVTDRAVQLLGGMGYVSDGEVERHYRDARILGIGGGADEVMADLAARLLGL